MEYVIQIRETYITYRKGIPCEMHLVPCCCSCHRQKKSFCAQCKAIHDLKKMFKFVENLCFLHHMLKKGSPRA